MKSFVLLFLSVTVLLYAQVDTAWVQRYNGPGNGWDEARSLAVDGQGNVYVTGYSTGSTTSYDYATIKYVPTQGVEENRYLLTANRYPLEVYPNPAKSFLTIRLPLVGATSQSRQSGLGNPSHNPILKIFDVSGKVVRVEELKNSRVGEFKVSPKGINPGIYFLQVGNELLTKKLVITK